MNIILYNDSLKYLNKSLRKLRNGHNINVPLINSINNQFLLGQGYLINTNITKVDQEQVKRITQILVELINKLKQIKNKVKTSPTSVPPTSVPPSSGFSSSGFSSSGFSSSGFSSSDPFGPTPVTATGFSSSGPFGPTPVTATVPPVDPTVTSSFTFRPGAAPSSSTTLDLNTCKNQLKAFLKGQKIMDNTENIVNPNGLSKIAYDRFVKIMDTVMSGFSQSQMDDCLNQLGVTIPR